jgi:hypothetical protein
MDNICTVGERTANTEIPVKDRREIAYTVNVEDRQHDLDDRSRNTVVYNVGERSANTRIPVKGRREIVYIYM